MALKTMLVSLNMNGNEIQNFLVHVLAAAPTAVEGKMYYNSTDNKLYYYNGTSWVDLTSSDDAFSKIKVGSSIIEADSRHDTLEIAAGSNVSVDIDTANDKITINAVDTTYDVATQSANGLMSAADKVKVDGLDDAAFKSVATSIDSSSTDSDLPTAKATYEYVAEAIAAADAMIFKGTIGAAADSPTVTSLPTTYKVGWTYRVITDGTYAGKVCEVGDLIIALVDRSGSGNLDSDWCVAQTNIDGAITSITAGNDILVSGSGAGRTISTKLRKGTATITVGSTSTTASVTDMVSYKAYDASTGEELIINATQGSSAVTFTINAAYTNAILIKYLYFVAS